MNPGAANKSNYFRVIVLALYSVAAPLIGMILTFAWVSQLENVDWPAPLMMLLFTAGLLLVGLALLPSIGFAGLVGYLTSDLASAVLLTTIGIYLATGLGIIWIQKASGDAVEKLFQMRERWYQQYQRLQHVAPTDSFKVLVVLRLSPHMPFALTNLAVAQLHYPLKKLVFYSWLGLQPRSLFAVYIGHSIDSISAALRVHLDPKPAIALTLFVVIYLSLKIRALGQRPNSD